MLVKNINIIIFMERKYSKMKKIVSVFLTVLMVASLCVSVFAANDGFVQSPTGQKAPEVVEFKPADENCTAKLVITPYGEHEELPQALQTLLNDAYTSIKNTSDITTLNADLTKIAADKNLKSTEIAVSELFDIHPTDCDFHDGHVDFDVTLDAETLKHFVALLHMNKNGQWEVVKDAKVVNNGEHLQFSVESFSPFAIVVDNKANSGSQGTGDSDMLYIYGGVAIVAAIGAAFAIVIKNKKENA